MDCSVRNIDIDQVSIRVVTLVLSAFNTAATTDMNDRLKELLAQITSIEDEIEDIIRSRREKLVYSLQDGRTRFRHDVEVLQKRFKVELLPWLMTSRPQSILSLPFIYGMLVPFVILDIAVTFYQAVCFPLYQINQVKRQNFIVIDRHHLLYLNIIERLHCMYCSYVNGLLSYAREIASRTEQYWCPIKHASRVLDKHSRYQKFADYGDAEDYRKRLDMLQRELRTEDSK